MLQQTTSIRELSATVKRDFGLNAELADVVEWAAAAIQLIGTSVPMTPKSLSKKIYDFKTTLPADFYSLDRMEYDGLVLPYGARIPGANRLAGSNVYTSAAYDTGEETVEGVQVYRSRQLPTGESGEYYFVDGDYVKTSFEEGTITIHYKAFPCDSAGLPMVPADVSSMKAMSWYVVYMTLQRGVAHPVISYKDARAEWLRYCAQAANGLLFPSPDKMEYLKERWLNTIRHDSN